MTNYPADVAEMALAHALRDKTEAAYRRGDLFEKRARLMADWARYCSKPATPAAVVPIRQNTSCSTRLADAAFITASACTA